MFVPASDNCNRIHINIDTGSTSTTRWLWSFWSSSESGNWSHLQLWCLSGSGKLRRPSTPVRVRWPREKIVFSITQRKLVNIISSFANQKTKWSMAPKGLVCIWERESWWWELTIRKLRLVWLGPEMEKRADAADTLFFSLAVLIFWLCTLRLAKNTVILELCY